MRIQSRFFAHFLSVLLGLVCSGVIANAADVVDVQIPPHEDVYGEDALDMYLRPSFELTNKMIDWSNTLGLHAKNLDQDGKLYIKEREAAKIAAFGPDDQWQGDLVDYVANVATKNFVEPLKNFVKGLVGKSDQLEREQAYADACQKVNNHYRPTVHDAKVMVESMHGIASTIIARYKAQNSQTSALDPFLPLPDITIPDPVTPRWRCKSNGIAAGVGEPLESLLTCLETYYFPTLALTDHRVLCGVEKDPNPNVAGCGRPWYTCQEGDGDAHAVKYCDNNISWHPPGLSLPKRLGKCGAAYRDCYNSQSRNGVHNYEPVYSYNGGNRYASSYQAKNSGYPNYTLSAHRGNMSSSSASFHGPTKYSESINDKIDETPNCSDCIDGSDHCPNASNHSSSSASASLSPSSGSYTASAGGTHTASVNVPSGYQYVYWYLAGPGIDGLGLLQETDYGYGSSTSADFSWSIPSYASGDHVITAYTYLSDWSIVEPSYTVSVGGGSSTDTTTTDTTTSTTDDDSSTTSTSPYSLSISNPGNTFYSGDTVTLNLSGYESYYSVSWEVDSPEYTSSFPLSYESGDGSSSSSSYTYTFPSGYTGGFVFRAIVYTYGNMTRYEETCTVTVEY